MPSSVDKINALRRLRRAPFVNATRLVRSLDVTGHWYMGCTLAIEFRYHRALSVICELEKNDNNSCSTVFHITWPVSAIYYPIMYVELENTSWSGCQDQNYGLPLTHTHTRNTYSIVPDTSGRKVQRTTSIQHCFYHAKNCSVHKLCGSLSKNTPVRI